MKCDELKVYEDIDDYIGYDDTPLMMYEKSEVDAAIAELKAMVATDNSEVIARLEAENMKLKSCIKCLVMRDLIKDCPEKKSVIEIVKEYK